MELFLKNIGKISTASIKINGITVIAGENNTGKSTISRALFSVFNAFHNVEDQIHRERVNGISSVLFRAGFFNYILERDLFAKSIVLKINKYKENPSAIRKEIKDELQQEKVVKASSYIQETTDLDKIVSHIEEILSISDKELQKAVVKEKLKNEFFGQVGNIYSNQKSEICLKIKNQCINISIAGDDVSEIKNENNISLYSEVVYIDDPFVLDEIGEIGRRMLKGSSFSHRSHLAEKLLDGYKKSNLVDEVITQQKFKNIYEKLSLVCDGTMVDVKTQFGYQRKDRDKILDIRNLSMGFKTFVILKMLLLNGSIGYNSTIILDEPEIHLHPQWQLLFAEVIVLLQKEFGMQILINTHSPYFLNALEVYTIKYGISDQCKYYLASIQEEGSVIEDVTNNIEKIYQKLARPFQDLENEAGSVDEP